MCLTEKAPEGSSSNANTWALPRSHSGLHSSKFPIRIPEASGDIFEKPALGRNNNTPGRTHMTLLLVTSTMVQELQAFRVEWVGMESVKESEGHAGS